MELTVSSPGSHKLPGYLLGLEIKMLSLPCHGLTYLAGLHAVHSCSHLERPARWKHNQDVTIQKRELQDFLWHFYAGQHPNAC